MLPSGAVIEVVGLYRVRAPEDGKQHGPCRARSCPPGRLPLTARRQWQRGRVIMVFDTLGGLVDALKIVSRQWGHVVAVTGARCRNLGGGRAGFAGRPQVKAATSREPVAVDIIAKK
jgi:hypothetical protein